MRLWLCTIVLGSAALLACGDSGDTGGTGASTNGGNGTGGTGATGDGGASNVTTTTNTSTTNTSTSTSTGTGGAPPECGIAWDPSRPDCDQCMVDACCFELSGCAPGTDCDALLTCVSNCANETCVDGCVDDHEQGLEDYLAVQDCFRESCREEQACMYPICESGFLNTEEACAECLTNDAECCGAFTACISDQECLTCATSMNPPASCDQNANYAKIRSCELDAPPSCGPQCTTSICDSQLGIPGNNECNYCLGGSCCQEIKDCYADGTCGACLTGNQSGAACDNSTLYQAFNTCVNTNCNSEC